MGSDETITIMKWIVNIVWNKLELFGITYSMKIKCICVHDLYCLLLGRKQIRVEFAPTNQSTIPPCVDVLILFFILFCFSIQKTFFCW